MNTKYFPLEVPSEIGSVTNVTARECAGMPQRPVDPLAGRLLSTLELADLERRAGDVGRRILASDDWVADMVHADDERQRRCRIEARSQAAQTRRHLRKRMLQSQAEARVKFLAIYEQLFA